ncbi:PREDICTED: transmembrane protein 94 isoform X2 [Nicrophorus vespilloides]|uniref:Transmembrane protein 94 isoform X2 n=1 Tax=Nicrophorus vespilloides TaxID=110193 RepID=A0ABM1NDV1_NICVS|nr:PREDICTED: transmembrane protein 94 isoform X2 [Nicrophorus vespilloides]
MEEAVGLTTKDALNRLSKEIEHVVKHYKTSHKQKHFSWLYDSLHHNSYYTNINWISTFLLLVCASTMILTFVNANSSSYLIYEATIILVIMTLAVILELFDNKLRHNEIMIRVMGLVKSIKTEMETVSWQADDYPHLYTPFSPCITLQWTYRDNKIVNLPWALLVQDDIIVVRPGQLSPGYCESLDKCSEYPLLHFKEVYGPTLQNANEIFSVPKARKPLDSKRYRMLETPILNNLKMILEQGLDRPITPHNKQRHLVIVRVIERIVLPSVLLLIFLINIIRFLYLENIIGRASWVDLFLLVPITTVLPLLPMTFPIIWNLLNYLGMARFKTLFDLCPIMKIKEELFDDQDTKTEILSDIEFDYRLIWHNFKDIILGRVSMLPRTANILQVLGSVTALCCVDKKGILSWPNPTAEKVFFLHNTENLSDVSSLANLNELNTDEKKEVEENEEEQPSEVSCSAIAEVLDVTYNPNEPFKLHFDDMKWHNHLNSLKPLGLSILLNTCNLDTQDHYTQFCAHITCEAMYNENLVPVTNRRCLCELAKEIGFLEQAQKIFSLEQQLSTFRHLQPEMVRRDNKYARSLSMSTKLKFPFPHMFAVVVKELSSGSMQLLSQGTADIVLDSCVDYWDGYDLCPLTPADRKKVQDFYQRSSLTAYCTAFAYRPLSKGVSDKLSKVYLELPSDSRHLYQCHRSPTPVHWDCRSVLEPKIRTPLGPFYSTDSLLYNDTPCSDVADADSCFDMQCNQVLIGLITMQYQAQCDMVHLIEQLERACIRFVHFSKENELRSRVFSEKMGLESGWNCHISLLSDRNRQDIGAASRGSTALIRRKSQSDRRLYSIDTPTNEFKNILDSNLESSRTMSFSAPSAINMDQTVVRFDIENEPLMKQISKDKDVNSISDGENANSQESVLMQETGKDTHDWQSLSCLTDSTEQSAPINFDMSNRAKLPRGIDKIRPHIEMIDNVPLLVSLFTDCTAASTKEMLHIMQDYGEVVCVIGSSANNENMGIFMQANASIGIEPIYPQVCQKKDACLKTSVTNTQKLLSSPIELSRSLNSIPCSLSFMREDPISIFHLVMEARHYISILWNTAQFWLSCCITLSMMQLVGALFMLPALLTPGQVIWIVCVLIPLLSCSLIGTKTDKNIMKKPQSKNEIIFNAELASFVIWCYGSKFLPAIFIVLVTFASSLASYCLDLCSKQNCSCILFYLPMEQQNSTVIGGWMDTEHSVTLQHSQNFVVFLILLHFVTISIGFVHREQNIWTRGPQNNFIWLSTVILLLLIQSIYTFISIGKSYNGNENTTTRYTLNMIILIFGMISPLITFIINELVKREEIRVNLRQQRRTRLEFGTKLGMNSPF